MPTFHMQTSGPRASRCAAFLSNSQNKFLIDDVAGVLTPGRNQLTLAGVTEEGDTFTGTGEITVIRRHGRR